MLRSLPLLVLLAACGQPVDGDDDTDALPATFTRVSQEVLKPSCAFSICHGSPGGRGTGGLELDGTHDDFDRLVGVESTGKAGAILVVPGDPEASYLVQKLEGAAGIAGERMPQNGELEADRLQLIVDWIAAGALDD